MSPEQIDAIVDSWRRATVRPDVLLAAVSDRLPGSSQAREGRAGWIISAVSRLSQVLDRPRTFASAARDQIVARAPVSTVELRVDRDALLGALDALLGPLPAESARAWALAMSLFEEIVTSECLDAFGACRPASQPPTVISTARRPGSGGGVWS